MNDTRATSQTPSAEKVPGVSRFQIAVATIMIAAGTVLYPSLPSRIPMHWNVAGEIDRWEPKSLWSVFFPVVVVLLMIALAYALPRLDPLKGSYGRFTHSYSLIMDLVVALFALIHGLSMYAAFNPDVQVGMIIPFAIGLMFAAMGNQFGKVKRNFFMGIKTPWTLASERVWTQTHRLAARVWVVGGLGAALSAFLPAPWSFVVFMTLVLAAAFVPMAASYVFYRRLEREGRLDSDMDVPKQA